MDDGMQRRSLAAQTVAFAERSAERRHRQQADAVADQRSLIGARWQVIAPARAYTWGRSRGGPGSDGSRLAAVRQRWLKWCLLTGASRLGMAPESFRAGSSEVGVA